MVSYFLTIYSDKGSAFYKFLRPEFVRSYSVPLNPDACSDFVWSEEKAEANDSIKAATDRLIHETIPEFARKLDVISGSDRDNYLLISSLHRNGINIRFLGHVRSHLKDEYWRTYLLVEMVARTAKCEIRSELRRKLTSMKEDTSVEACKTSIIKYPTSFLLQLFTIKISKLAIGYWRNFQQILGS
jgi:hypothetical protein